MGSCDECLFRPLRQLTVIALKYGTVSQQIFGVLVDLEGKHDGEIFDESQIDVCRDILRLFATHGDLLVDVIFFFGSPEIELIASILYQLLVIGLVVQEYRQTTLVNQHSTLLEHHFLDVVKKALPKLHDSMQHLRLNIDKRPIAQD